jgi:pimeloyl-ACP methyl ester carboxylesterase
VNDVPSDLVSPVVLLHGATSSSRAWAPLLSGLAAHHSVFAPTLAGHFGGPILSAAPHLVVPGIVDAMCRQLDAADIDTAHLVGNSLGGWVALELARRGRARSVVALSPAGAWRQSKDLTRLLAIFRAASAAARMGNALRRLTTNGRMRRIVLRIVAEHADRLSPTQVSEVLEDIAGCAVLTDLLDGARHAGAMAPLINFDIPVRIVWGAHDRLLPFMRYGAPMLAAVPGAELIILPGVGHVPMIDDPDLVVRTILEFTTRRA